MVKAKDNAEVYGIYANEDSSVLATGYVGALEADGTKVKLDGTSYKTTIVYTANTTMTVTPGAAGAASTVTYNPSMTTLQSYIDLAAKGTVTPATAASTIKLIDNNGDGKVDSAVYTPVQVAKVTAVSKTSVTLDYLTAGVANATIKFEDADIYDGIARDDFVTVVKAVNRSTDNDLVSKLSVVSAKADATRTNEVKVDGTWYKLAKNEGTVIPVTTGNTYDFVMVGGVVVNADETAASASNIAYISGIEKNSDNTTNKLETSIGESTGTLKVRMYFQDGTDKEVKVSKIDGKKIGATSVTDQAVPADLISNVMYTYSELSDGTYDVKAVNGNNKVGMDWVSSVTLNTKYGSTYGDQKISDYSIADDAVVFVQTSKETKVLTGKQVKNWADDVNINFLVAGTQVLTKATNGIDYVKFATLVRLEDTSNIPGASKDTVYAYLTANPYQATVNGEKKAAYDVWTGSENTTLYEDASSSSVSAAVAGKVISYSVNGDYIEKIAVVGDKVAITGLNDGVVAYQKDATKVLTADLDDDCVFIAINDDENEGMEGSKDTVTKANEFVNSGDGNDGKTYLIPNAYIVLNSDGDVVAIVYDADNSELDVTYSAGNVTNLIEKK